MIDEATPHIENATGVQIQLSDTAPNYKATNYWRNLKRRARRTGYPLLKQILVDRLKVWVANYREYCTPDKPILTITMPCGNFVSYATFDDIPEVDVPCPCGDDKHQLIRYMDLRK